MKRMLILLLATTLFHAANAQHTLTKLWETDSVFKTPESVLYDAKEKLLYVTNMHQDKAGLGSVSKLGPDGKIIKVDWVSGLTSPKGMGIYKNLMYVAELTDVAVIDINKAAIIKRIPVAGAEFLNDITVDKAGTVYVSDSKTLKVHSIDKNNTIALMQHLQGPNGLLSVDNDLLVLDKGSLLKLLPDGQVASLIGGMDPSTDGVESPAPNEYIVSCWNGVIYYVFSNGVKQTLLDTRPQKINSADIGYDAHSRIVYVPTFFRNTVAAYQLR